MDVIKGGDVITLVSELLNINAFESAKHINNILNLGVNFEKKTSNFEIEKYNCKLKVINKFREWEKSTFFILCNYLHILRRWENIRVLQNDLFVEALQNKDYIEYVIDNYFIDGTDEDKIWLWKNERAFISKISKKLNDIQQKGENNE